MARKIGILAPAFGTVGGITAWTSFMLQAIGEQRELTATVVSVATARDDAASRRALVPSSWTNHPVVWSSFHDGTDFVHVGSTLAEVEPIRYWPHRRLNAILRGFDAIVVVCGTPVWGWLARRSGKPVVLLMASLVAQERQRRLQTAKGIARLWNRGMARIVSSMEPAALRHAQRVFVLNRRAERQVAALVGPSRVQRVAVGVDVSLFSPPATYAENGYLLAVGRMNDPRKNLPFLLRSYAAVRAALPSVPELVIVGEPLNVEFRQVLTSSGVAGFVRFIHNATREQLIDLYRGASLLLIPSAEEGFGIVAIESMACGVPVIATKCGGPEDVITEGVTGHLACLDVEAFASAVALALGNVGARRDMSRHARRAAVNEYSIESAGAPYLSALSKL